MANEALRNVAKRYRLTTEQLEAVFDLFDDGYSVPYLMYYRKELSGGLEADDLYDILEEKRRLEKLESRRRKIIKKLDREGVLSEELEQQLQSAQDMRELIDHYVPYRPRDNSWSRRGMALGLDPLARVVLTQEEFIDDLSAAAAPYVSPEDELPDVATVLEAVVAMICDALAEEKAHRDRQRQVLRKDAVIVTRRSGKRPPEWAKRQFRDYFDFREAVRDLQSHKMLSILRGTKLKVLKYRIEPPLEKMALAAADLHLAGSAEQFKSLAQEFGGSFLSLQDGDVVRLNSAELLCYCIEKSLRQILAPLLVKELDRELCHQAEKRALQIVKRNARSMLLMAPRDGERVLGINTGYRTGCELAALDESGGVLELDTVYPHVPRNEWQQAKERIVQMINEHGLTAVGIGKGTGTEETEQLLGEIIGEQCQNLRYGVVTSEALDQYARSVSAREELPQLGVDMRKAVSIGRRLLDPMRELLKVSPDAFCHTPFAENINKAELERAIPRVVEECVCRVGVELQSAPWPLLQCLPGLTQEVAQQVVHYRQQKGQFRCLAEFRNVPKVDEKLFRNVAGFLRLDASENPLDRTRIHPEHYPIAEAICSRLSLATGQLGTEQAEETMRRGRSEIKLSEVEKQFKVHYLLLKDIMDELANPWPDPRRRGKQPVLRKCRLSFGEIAEGEILYGTVRNITGFGVFVDIGVGEDGLIHVSELSDGFVPTPFDLVNVGETVKVRVLSVDEQKRRIALSMRSESGTSALKERKAPKLKARRPTPSGGRGQEHAAAADRPPRPIQQPQSTWGAESRRVKRAELDRPLSKTDEHILRPRPQPFPEKASAEEVSEKTPEVHEGIGKLLGKLGFANIEKRGKPSDLSSPDLS